MLILNLLGMAFQAVEVFGLAFDFFSQVHSRTLWTSIAVAAAEVGRQAGHACSFLTLNGDRFADVSFDDRLI